MTGVERVLRELEDLGYMPAIHAIDDSPGNLVVIDYVVPSGRYRDRVFRLGIGFQETAYPEYPPHFIGVLNLPGTRLTVHRFHDQDHDRWSLFSAPPTAVWESLPAERKTMKTYLDRHVMRFWSQM